MVCRETGYKVLNDGSATHIDRGTGAESCIDLTIIDENLKERCKWEVLNELESDHKPILITIEGKREGLNERVKRTWAWRKANWEKFKEELEKRRTKRKEGSLKRMIEVFNEEILEAATSSIPKTKAAWANRPYWSDELTKLTEKKAKLRKREDRRMEGGEQRNE
jgi:hypothetical protein